MSRIERVKVEIETMSPAELATFRKWFARFGADAWDGQFEADVAAGKWDGLAEAALRDDRFR